MTNIPITLGTAGILGLVYLVLCGRVTQMRIRTKVSTGDGAGKAEAEPLMIAMRAQANFSEYVPIILILLGGIEAAGAARFLCVVLSILLVISRIAHPFGMAMPAPNPFRAGGAMLTWLVLLLVSIGALYLAL